MAAQSLEEVCTASWRSWKGWECGEGEKTVRVAGQRMLGLDEALGSCRRGVAAAGWTPGCCKTHVAEHAEPARWILAYSKIGVSFAKASQPASQPARMACSNATLAPRYSSYAKP